MHLCLVNDAKNIHNIKLELNGPGYNYNGKFSKYKSLKVVIQDETLK